jgi:hypothetical protein
MFDREVLMRCYDLWREAGAPRLKARAVGPNIGYWLRRRGDLLDCELDARRGGDLVACEALELAVDLLADATGHDELALKAAPDFAVYLDRWHYLRGCLLWREGVCDWVVAWVASEIGLTRGVRDQEGGRDG